jgi:lipoprotein-anchoring transpeptidase ErfK/SrfK
MSRASKAIGALAAVALVAEVVAFAVLLRGDSSETTAGSSPPVLTVGKAPRPKPPSVPAAVKSPPHKPPPVPGVAKRPQHEPQLVLSDRKHPIVWLRRGARIQIRSAPRGKVVKTVRWRTQFDSRTVLAVFRRVGRWAGVPTPLVANGDLGWVKLDPSKLRSGWTPYAIDIDLSSRAAQLRRGDRVLRSFTVTVGAPGTATPTGRFAVTDTFRGNINPAYGCCAVATTARQLSLPSGWLGGDRIAIHGTTGPLGVAASHGCVRAADEDVNALVNTVQPGAPVIIRQ